MLSTGRITESIGKLAIEKGWDCYIIHGARYARPGSCMHSIQAVSKLGEYVHYAESLLLDNHGLASRRATKAVIEQIKQIQPDLIQLHCVHGYYINYKLLFEYLNTTNIPVVWTFHDCWAFTGHCAHFVTAGCEKWKIGCDDCPLKGDYPKSLLDFSKRNFTIKKELFSNNSNLHIVAVSEWLANLTKESFLKEKDIRIINNGVDIDKFQINDKESNVLNKKKYCILAVASSWTEEKGLSDYVKLSYLLSDEEELIMIGVDDKTKYSLPLKIKCLPRTNSIEELVKWYNTADVVLSLSKAETFGLTIAESLSCGTPVIVYDNTAQPELVTSSTGFVVENGNVNAVYVKIRDMKRIGKTSFSNACRERAKMIYNREKCFEKYIDLYDELLLNR